MEILNYIPIGHKNAISRDTLGALTQLSDRKVRDLIAEVNKNNNDDQLIINLQDGCGYFRPAPEEDYLVRVWRSQERARGSSVRESVDAADRYLTRNRRKEKKKDELEENQIGLSDWLGSLM